MRLYLLGVLIIGLMALVLGCSSLPQTVVERGKEVKCFPVNATRCAGQVVQVCTQDGPWMAVSDCLQQGPEWRCLEAPDKTHYCGKP